MSFSEKIAFGVFITLAGFFLLLLLSLPFVRFSTTGEGEHVGYITAVDQDGIFFKNYVVYFKTDTRSSQEDKYCINRANESVISKAKAANVDQKRVVLKYHGVRGFGLAICNGEEIDNIK